ncbi:hypothetical protein C8R43DRAFT_1069256 [Mycena crocata]|nr:hypothetical protein C8R43DRAFT_1069256 [Mycena crocata]
MPELCIELLQEIGAQLGRKDHKSLRAASRAFRLTMDPIFFASFVLNTHLLHLDDTRELLESLAKNQTGWPQHAKVLTIKAAEHYQAKDELEAKSEWDATVVELVGAGLGRMKNVQSVVWHLDHCNTALVKPICGFLNELPVLHCLELRGSLKCELSLLLSGLRTLKLRARQGWGCALSSEQLAHLVIQNPNLTALHLYSDVEFSAVWSTLQNANTHLREVETNSISTSLLTYLKSYAGLERLALEEPGSGCWQGNEDDELADRLYHTVLPRHAESLRSLSCKAWEGAWSFTSRNAAVISSLHRLETLDIGLNRVHVQAKPSIVGTFLETCAHLHRLRFITLRPAGVRNMMGNACRRAVYRAEDNNEFDIARLVLNFRTASESSAVLVLTGDRYYELKPVESEGLLGYRQIEDPTRLKALIAAKDS